MSVYLSLDSGEPEMLASNKGWSDFCGWADELENDEAELIHLCDHGWSQDLPALEKAVTVGLKSAPPSDRNVIKTAHLLQELLNDRGVAEVCTVNSGMSEENETRLSAQYHGPDAPGPDWKQVGVGPQGGKIWEHEGDATTGDPKQGRIASSFENIKAAVAKAQAAQVKVSAYLDSKTNQPGVRQAKAVVGAALGAVKKTQGALYGVMEQRYGKAGARSIFIASQLIGGNPVVMPAWFVAIPGATILAQLPMMGIAEVVLQTGRVTKAIVARLSEADVELSDDEVQELAKELLGKLYVEFLAVLEPHKDALAEAFTGLQSAPV